jgi:hypothetical protein
MAGAGKCYRLVRAGILAASAALAGPMQAQSAAGGGHRQNCRLYTEHDRYTPEALNGCYAWDLWTGGTEYMWRERARRGIVDILEITSSGRVSRAERWPPFGLINDPACRQAENPDQYGLRFDECAVVPLEDAAAAVQERRPDPARGHHFGSDLPDAEKTALIEYMKTR